MKKKRKLNIKAVFMMIMILFIITGISGFFYINDNLKSVSNENNEVVFNIERGDSLKEIINNLKDEKLIKNKDITYFYIKYKKLTNIKSGKYILNKNWDVLKIFNFINTSTNTISDESKVTLIEGDWAKDIALKISNATNLKFDDILNKWNDIEYIKSLQNDYPFLTDEIFNGNIRILLEGYLFPNTYIFAKETDIDTITRKLLDQTYVIYKKYKKEIEKSNLSIHQIFTLSSIVQYEASDIANMKKIAGVFYNRLSIDMKLQSSVTVCYAIDKEKTDDWKKCEVNPNFDSLYNTYKYKGLPPGPILNPGEKAIEATLNPENTDYLYFMADVYGDGSVYYSKTYKQHQAYVNKYLR